MSLSWECVLFIKAERKIFSFSVLHVASVRKMTEFSRFYQGKFYIFFGKPFYNIFASMYKNIITHMGAVIRHTNTISRKTKVTCKTEISCFNCMYMPAASLYVCARKFITYVVLKWGLVHICMRATFIYLFMCKDVGIYDI